LLLLHQTRSSRAKEFTPNVGWVSGFVADVQHSRDALAATFDTAMTR